MKIIKDRGVVIKDVDFEDSSKILTIFTEGHGKIQAIANHCRKTHNPLIGISQPLIYGNYILIKNNDVYTIKSASLIESFIKISENYSKNVYANYFFELIDSFFNYEDNHSNVLRLTLNALFLLENDFDAECLSRIFEIKLISFAGFFPNLLHCSVCKNNNINEVYFSNHHNGILCNKCKSTDSIKINLDIIKIILLINMTEIKKIHKISIPPKLNNPIKELMISYIESILQKKLQILDFLKYIK